MNRELKEPQTLSSVREFHELVGQPVLIKPTIPSKERVELRIRLLQEELDELKLAVEGKGDLVEVADALVDLQYILSGTVHEFGMGEYFKDLFDEVHRSNLSKVCLSTEEALESCQYWEDKDQSPYYIKKNGKFVIYRSSDHKVLKSINYSPASLAKILEK